MQFFSRRVGMDIDGDGWKSRGANMPAQRKGGKDKVRTERVGETGYK